MSTIFEGIVCPVAARELEELSHALASDLALATEQMDASLSVVYRIDGRRHAIFTERIDRLAAALSLEAGRALVVRWDDRVGHRSSELYKRGILMESFGEEDEVWVVTDDDARPIPSAPQLRIDELDPDEEYATLYNAIQLGLKAFGQGRWEDLFSLIR